MNRRHFLQATISTGGALSFIPRLLAAGTGAASNRFLLSSTGCGRATGYAEANKIVTLGDKTHVCWLDSVSGGFRVRARTLDRRAGQWSPTSTAGEAYDNHGGPALTADSKGFLHVVYYPHHHAFRYRRSKRPNDASQWDEEIRFGERCTYPTLLCAADDTLYLTCRRSFARQPWQMELWKKPPNDDWQGPTPIARARYPGYAHFQESLAWSPDRRLLHLCCRLHEKTDKDAYGRVQTVGYMVSDDGGTSWRRSDGSRIDTPATAETIEGIASGGVDKGVTLRAGAMAVDADGTPHVIYSTTEGGRSDTLIATPRGDGQWRRSSLSQHLPERWKDWDVIMAGGITFNRDGKLFAVATIQRLGEGEQSWGHPGSEVVQLSRRDHGDALSFQVISQPDKTTAHWLPNIEKPTGHNTVPAQPGIIYTAGPPGQKNTDILSNGVWWFG